MKRIAGVINLFAAPVVLALLVSTSTYGQDKSVPLPLPTSSSRSMFQARPGW
jgi:hypothetical protein